MKTYFDFIPLELINNVILNLERDSIDPFFESLTHLEIYDQLDSESNWGILFYLKFPDLHSTFNKLKQIDPTFRKHRYQSKQVWYRTRSKWGYRVYRNSILQSDHNKNL